MIFDHIIFLQDGIDGMLESASDIDNTPDKVTADNIDTRQDNQNRSSITAHPAALPLLI